ncbi:hypothetical protein NL676_034842 [Syzygium grande]|nr:hypothetical protein NL676_034842 [Syzygium grande]
MDEEGKVRKSKRLAVTLPLHALHRPPGDDHGPDSCYGGAWGQISLGKERRGLRGWRTWRGERKVQGGKRGRLEDGIGNGVERGVEVCEIGLWSGRVMTTDRASSSSLLIHRFEVPTPQRRRRTRRATTKRTRARESDGDGDGGTDGFDCRERESG